MTQTIEITSEEVGSCGKCVREPGANDPFVHDLINEHWAIYVHFDDDFEGDAILVMREPDKDPDAHIKPQYKDDSQTLRLLFDKLLYFYHQPDADEPVYGDFPVIL